MMIMNLEKGGQQDSTNQTRWSVGTVLSTMALQKAKPALDSGHDTTSPVGPSITQK
jgi:hypothetical protein